jgi:hypothetical protein
MLSSCHEFPIDSHAHNSENIDVGVTLSSSKVQAQEQKWKQRADSDIKSVTIEGRRQQIQESTRHKTPEIRKPAEILKQTQNPQSRKGVSTPHFKPKRQHLPPCRYHTLPSRQEKMKVSL